jgi:hypothetical protein
MEQGMNHPLDGLIIQAFKNVVDREIAEENVVRDEIKQKGTYWAGSEIWKLRRQVQSLREQLQAAKKHERPSDWQRLE